MLLALYQKHRFEIASLLPVVMAALVGLGPQQCLAEPSEQSMGNQSPNTAASLPINLEANVTESYEPQCDERRSDEQQADEQRHDEQQSDVRSPNMVPNFQRLSNGIWRGSAPSDKALTALAGEGVKTIVDLRLDGSGVDKESTVAHKLGIKYYHFPLGFKKPSSHELVQILSIMTDPSYQPVFIHCRQGADRTGMLCGIYRHVWQGWSLKQTYAEMREHHFKPFLVALWRQVRWAGTDKQIIAMRALHPASSGESTAQTPGSVGTRNNSSVSITMPAENNSTAADLIVSKPALPLN